MKLRGVTALLRAGAMDEEPLIFKIAKDQLGRLRREGWTRAQQASALFVMVQDRHCKEYLDRFPWLLADLGLELEVNLAPSCLPAPVPVLQWIEAELWDHFVDWYEANIGMESEGLQRLRERPTMSAAELARWREWANSGSTTPGTRTRSRSPAGRQRERREQDHGDDLTSLMHRGGRGSSSWEDHGRMSRGSSRRRASSRRRGRSRDRREERRTPTTREERIRQRVTEETRHLTPWTCRDNHSGWSEPSRPASTGGERAAPSTTRVAPSSGHEMDSLEATSEWTRMIGLRQPGQERVEPCNALMKHVQVNARRQLGELDERNLVIMTHALMRLMGMLYIELATREAAHPST